MMNINEALLYASTKFKKVNNIVAALDARLLLAYALDKPYEYLLLNSGKILTTDEQERFLKIVNERERLKPLAYILKYKEFYSRNFKLNDNVLIPRSDTETLIDAVLSSSQVPSTRILELGCGSGCIIISLLLEMPKSRGVACDISVSAIDCTVANAQKHNVDSRLEVIKSNWFDNIREEKFDIIVCNPPYISEHETHLMSRETLLHEPRAALFANDCGLADYKIIASNAAKFLKCNGELFLEIGFNQLEAVKQIFVACGFIFENSYHDINKHNRVLKFRTM